MKRSWDAEVIPAEQSSDNCSAGYASFYADSNHSSQ